MSEILKEEKTLLRKGTKDAGDVVKKSILVEGNTVRVSELRFESREVARFLMEKPTPDEQRRAFIEAVEMGVAVLQRVEAGREIEFVRRKFESFASQLEKKVEDLENTFKEQVTGTLNLEKDGSAARRLVIKFEELHEAVRRGIQEARKELQDDQRSLENFMNGFEKKMFQCLNPGDRTSFLGKVMEELKSYFDPRAGKVPELLDQRLSFEKEDSPFQRFAKQVQLEVSELKKEIEAYRTALLKEEEVVTEKERGTAKGFEFEDEFEAKLHEIARPHGDEVERVSTVAQQGKTKAGDFVYKFKEGGRAAIDTKNEAMTSLKRYREILDSAMKARDAGYGMIIAKDPSQLQQQVGEWNEYEGNKLITSLPYTEIAINWARLRMKIGEKAREGVDVESLQTEIQKIEASLKSLRTVRGESTSIEKSKDKILQVVDAMEKQIKESIEAMMAELSSGN